jgi:hypothetical protein
VDVRVREGTRHLRNRAREREQQPVAIPFDELGREQRSDVNEQFTKLGVEDWRAYFNLQTQRFELTDGLRAHNKEARKRWSEGNDSANSGS